MEMMLTIECDNCTENICIDLSGNYGQKWIDPLSRKARKELKEQGWHILKTCLCPDCMSKVGNKNCMNCRNMAYNDFNYRCHREITREDGFVIYEGSVVSEYDNCEHFEPRRYKNPIPEVE